MIALSLSSLIVEPQASLGSSPMYPFSISSSPPHTLLLLLQFLPILAFKVNVSLKTFAILIMFGFVFNLLRRQISVSFRPSAGSINSVLRDLLWNPFGITRRHIYQADYVCSVFFLAFALFSHAFDLARPEKNVKNANSCTTYTYPAVKMLWSMAQHTQHTQKMCRNWHNLLHLWLTTCLTYVYSVFSLVLTLAEINKDNSAWHYNTTLYIIKLFAKIFCNCEG